MHYKYIIRFTDGEEKIVDIQLDPATLTIVHKKPVDAPDWALLEFGKCGCCPFDGISHKYCPIALNLADVTRMFSDHPSTAVVDARVIAGDREYFKKTSLQTALSSAIGIYMAASGCPVMRILKPMVRHHLPFASLNETVYRTVSYYLLQQYLRHKKGQEPDWELKKLSKAYESIRVLNKAIVDRVRQASKKDANYNALIILDVFAKMVPWTIDHGLPDRELHISD